MINCLYCCIHKISKEQYLLNTLNHCEHLQTLSGQGLMTTDQPPAYIPTASNYCAILCSHRQNMVLHHPMIFITNIWHCIIQLFLTVHIFLLATPWPWHLASYCCMELLNNMSTHLTQYMYLWHYPTWNYGEALQDHWVGPLQSLAVVLG